jgi:hypothetical protein
MKVLSIRQPWASLIAWNIKDVENRNWKTNYRGPFLIHACASFDDHYSKMREYNNCDCPSDMFTTSQWSALNNNQRRMILHGDLPQSAIIGLTNLIYIGYFWPGQSWAEKDSKFHWHVDNSIEFKTTIINVKGNLSLWNYDVSFDNLQQMSHVSNIKTHDFDD